MEVDAPPSSACEHPIRDLLSRVAVLEALSDEVRGNATEYLNMRVDGNRVSFDTRFFNDSGDCFGTSGSEVTIQGHKIALYDCGEGDDSLCD